jgi:two-component system cell cycle sensor histidine kinase/response regulator CckA
MDDTPSRDIAEPTLALASAVEPLRWVLDDVAIGIFSRTAGRFVVTTRAFRDALGSHDPETLASVHTSELDAQTEDVAVVQAGGRRATVRVRAQPVSDPHAARHFVVSVADVTAETSAQAGTAAAAEWFSAAIKNAPVILWWVDRDGIFTLSEGRGLAALGLAPGQVVGQSVYDVYREAPDVLSAIDRAMGGESFTMTTCLGPLAFEAWMSPKRGADGMVEGVIGLVTDVTERRRLEARVTDTDRLTAMGTLAASVAHEVNNPLSYLLMSLDGMAAEVRAIEGDVRHLVANGGGDSREGVDGGWAESASRRVARLAEQLAVARDGAERVRVVTRDLKTFTGVGDTRPHAVDVSAVARSTVERAKNQLEERARVVIDLAPVPTIEASETRLGQVVRNLLMNAAQAIPEGHPERNEIRLVTRAAAGHVEITVADTGPGVDPDLRARIFEPFFTTKPVGAGTGLGLFVCRNIIAAMGGDIDVGESPGGGALFRVRLPVSTAPRAAPRADEPPAHFECDEARPRVLIVDDEPRLTEAFAVALAEDYDVTIERTGTAAVEALASGAPFDLVLCDLMMKDLSGIDVYEQLRARCPGVERRLVFMTGGAFTVRARAFLEAIPNPRLEKPFDVRLELRRLFGRPPASSTRR